MALMFMEGFDTFSTTAITPSTGGFSVSPAFINGELAQSGWVLLQRTLNYAFTRTGRGLSLGFEPTTAGGSSGEGLARLAFPSRNEIICGFAMWHSSLSNFFSICSLRNDNYQGSTSAHVVININDSNGITANWGNNSGEIAVSEPNVIFSDTWNYIEIRAKAGLTTGSLIVKVNGCVVISVDNVQTINPAFPANYNQWSTIIDWFDTRNQYRGPKYDDLYICDTSGADFNDFLGDVVIEDLLPTGDTGTNEMAIVGDVLGHFDAVNEIGIDDDITYLTTNDANVVERFQVADLNEDVIDVLAVQVSAYSRREGTAYKTWRPQITVNGETSEGEDKFAASSYTEQGTIFTNVPAGSGWTVADVNAMQIGMRTTS